MRAVTRFTIGSILATVVLSTLVVGCSDGGLRNGSGTITAAGSMAVADLRPGDCYRDLSTGGRNVPVVPCDQVHVAQVFARVRLVGGYGPGGTDVFSASMMQSEAQQACAKRFTSAIGAPPERSRLAVEYFAPTEDGWTSDDDRTVVCSVVDAEGAPLTSSVLD